MISAFGNAFLKSDIISDIKHKLISVYKCMCLSVYVQVYCMNVCMYVCVGVSMCVCMCVSICEYLCECM